jgi:DNA-binding NtrC family response regulator
MATILVVDDELGIRDLLCEILNDEGHHVELAENAAQAREIRQRMRPDLVLLDIWMPDTDGVTLLKEWSTTGALTMPVIMMSGHATIETAVEATRIGAQSFLEKPITLQKLLKAVESGLQRDTPAARKPGRGGDDRRGRATAAGAHGRRRPSGAPDLRIGQATARSAR